MTSFSSFYQAPYPITIGLPFERTSGPNIPFFVNSRSNCDYEVVMTFGLPFRKIHRDDKSSTTSDSRLQKSVVPSMAPGQKTTQLRFVKNLDRVHRVDDCIVLVCKIKQLHSSCCQSSINLQPIKKQNAAAAVY